jgi:aspartyl-tRNA(Asn)/glutamyl-tRNA(Gln) amidotransferase subunit A
MSLPQSIREIHDAYDRKAASPLELTREFLKAAKGDTRNAYLTVCEDRALAQAKRAEERLKAKGKVPREEEPLFGVPLAVKDVLVVDGVRTTCGSRMLENYVPPYTATAVLRLERAGAITLGKTNMDEFAMGSSNENSAFGPVKHPTHADRVPGGSSGGSGTAVGAGLCVAALGTDTGGSVRLPASYCGVVGMKPTYGRVSRYGLVAFASSLDQVGPIARSVEDAASVLRAMSGHDPLDSTSATQGPLAALSKADLSKLRIGVPKEYFVEGLDPAVEKAVRESLSWFEKKGAKLVPVSLPHTSLSVAVYYLVAVSEASSNLARFDGVRFGRRPPEAMHASELAEFYRKVRAGFGAEVKRRIILGTFALSAGYSDAYYKRACQVRRLIKRDFDEAFTKVDVIAGPVAPTTAFKLGEKVSDPLKMYLNDIFTIPVNLAGLPALSLPCGQDSAKLPIGLHLVGPAFGDEKLLSVAREFEIARKGGG